MKSHEYVEKLLHWTSGGALSTSLAFIVFVPTLDKVDPVIQDTSISFFVLSIPFLALALARYKEYEIKGTNNNSKGVYHVASAFSGFIFMVIGFGALLAAIDVKYPLIFLASILLLLLVETFENRGTTRAGDCGEE